MVKSTRLHLLSFAVLNPCLSVSSFYPLFVLFFCTPWEMPTRPGRRMKYGVHTSRRTAKPTKNQPFVGIVSYVCVCVPVDLGVYVYISVWSWTYLCGYVCGCMHFCVWMYERGYIGRMNEPVESSENSR